ncbi:interferon-induced protein 44-like [Pangasianodon hypophthalmus]|uniref:interferon-induced protein 44-like n=1 Tax=Pangasianodon hypophthalmus TaxID=310915 RepID=UPI002306FCBE|nr:interferon-induced protein 44-like [Pangasianodon hypophthalmus]XP_034156230.2 interferon-induced protein 44-like [Pangasianodon hypophthalmus]
MHSFASFFGSSKSNSSPPPSKQFDREWRSVNWDGRDQLEADLREFKIRHPEITHLRILLHGAVGAGKSSFINSAKSVFQHRVMTRAGAASSSSTSHTKRYKSYRIRDGKNSTLPFIFNDIMGLQDTGTPGIHSGDITNAMLGHVKENYPFNPTCPLRDGDAGYISCPTLNDKVHCLVSVISAKTISNMHNAVIRSMKDVREKASDLGIPQVVILTHIDELCPLVQKNLRDVYISKKIKEKMSACSDLLGIPMNCIFPVKNYHEESDTNNDADVLVLLALRQIFNFANDYVEDL